MDKIVQKCPPPHDSLCPSPNNVGFRSLRAKTLCVFYSIGGRRKGGRRGRGRTFKNVFEALFPCLWKKNRDIF